MHSYDPQPGLGDLGYDQMLREMAAGAEPLVSRSGALSPIAWHLDDVALTDTGHAVLDGKRDWLESHVPERWVGGVRIAGKQRNWRWDERVRDVVLK